jgi:hypothetical protein
MSQKSTVISSRKIAFLLVMPTECDCRLVTFSCFQESATEYSATGGRTEDEQDGDLTDEVILQNFTVGMVE